MKFVLTLNVSDRNYSKIKINICWIFKLLKIRLSPRSFQIKLTRLPDISVQKSPNFLSKTSTKALFFGLIFLLTDGATIVRKKKYSVFTYINNNLIAYFYYFWKSNFKNKKNYLNVQLNVSYVNTETNIDSMCSTIAYI